MADEPFAENVVGVQSGVNPKGEPFVQLLFGNRIVCQMTAAQAREHALALVMAAEAAEGDAFITKWVLERVGADMMAVAGLLGDFRKFRLEQTGKRTGSEDRDTWVVPDGWIGP